MWMGWGADLCMSRGMNGEIPRETWQKLGLLEG